MTIRPAVLSSFALLLTLSLYSCQNKEKPQSNALPSTDVSFNTTDTVLQALFDLAEAKAAANIRQYTDRYRVLVEGGPYPFVWSETQPMGGVMYGKRDLEIALNNIVIFLDHQREDGLIPSLIVNMDNDVWNMRERMVMADSGRLGLFFSTLQGIYLAEPALELARFLPNPDEFLLKLATALEGYDAYLWRHRDSDGDGCLEAWTMTDTGEDHNLRLQYAPWEWPFDYPPIAENIPADDTLFLKTYWSNSGWKTFSPEKLPVPMESIDLMGYSYSCRHNNARIYRQLGEIDKANVWQKKAEEVQDKMNSYLWRPERQAYFYRDPENEFINSLTHNNLRAMYYGTMTQEMADGFISGHLLNPEEFWTPVPLPSVAANDSLFRNIRDNNWSGQPQGLTFQRAIRALENYGHYAEVVMIGQKLLETIGRSRIFTQQYDPYTGEPNGPDGYGPTILAVLEYYSRLYGVEVVNDSVHFSGIPLSEPYTYSQQIGEQTFTLEQQEGTITGKIGGKEIFRCSAGLRIHTDRQGKLAEMIWIMPQVGTVELHYRSQTYRFEASPNQVFSLRNEEVVPKHNVPFSSPTI